MMAGGIEHFLSSVGMEHHLNMFRIRGYDDESDIPHLNMSDLQSLGIINPMEIVIILKAAHSYKHRPEYELLRWLREHGLSHYFEGFIQSGWILLTDVAQMNLPDEQLYDELEITLPGHKRRLERAVCALRKRQRNETSDTEELEGRVVTEGWWGFPKYLPNAKYPFLCVRANVQSTCQLENQKSIDFMVDSGSDVSTLRNDVIQELDLEPITTVRSCGAHGSVRTTMYRAYVTIGDAKLEIEIIGSSYDSLGSRVLRHFNHHIDRTRHKWFRVSNASASRSGSQVSLSSGENRGAEAETVSVLPDRERGALFSSTIPRNTGSRNDGGISLSGVGGGSDSSTSSTQGANTFVSKDETDSMLLHNYHLPSTYLEADHNGSKILWDSSYRSYPPSGSSSQILHDGDPVTFSDDSASAHVNSPWRDDTVTNSRTKQKASSHQEGHLTISEDGSISLSFGHDIRRKRH